MGKALESLSYHSFCHEYIYDSLMCSKSFPGGSVVKNLPANVGDEGSVLRWGRYPGVGNGNPLQYSSLGNPMDGGAWQATVHEIVKVRHHLATKRQ